MRAPFRRIPDALLGIPDALPCIPAALPCNTDALPCNTDALLGIPATLPCIAAALPCITDALPCIADALPCITDALPCIADALPCITDALPCNTDALPRIPAALPCIPAALPCITDALPRIPAAVPRIPDALPCITDALPCIPAAVPRITDALPRIPDAVPRIPDAVPRIPDAVPRIPDAVPYITDAVPYITAAVLRIPDAVPCITAVAWRKSAPFSCFAPANVLRVATVESARHGGRPPAAARRARPSHPAAGIDPSQGRNIMGTEANSHPRAALGVKRANSPGVIRRANIMYAAILAALATFDATPITMAAFLLLIEAAQAAQTASASRAKGLAAVRNTKITPLWNAMNLLCVYVQGLVDQVDDASGLALINQAGLVVGGVGGYVKKLFVATLDPTANVVHLVLNAKAFLGQTRKLVSFSLADVVRQRQDLDQPALHAVRRDQLPSPGPGSYLFRAAATVGTTVVDWTPPFPLTIH